MSDEGEREHRRGGGSRRHARLHEVRHHVAPRRSGLRNNGQQDEDLFEAVENGERCEHALIALVRIAPLARERVADRSIPEDVAAIRRRAGDDADVLCGAS